MSIPAPGMPERLRAMRARIEALSGPYAAQLPATLAGIEACWADIEAADGGGDRLGPFYAAIHPLAGTAGAYGFAEVSRQAAAIDTLVGRARRETRALTAEDKAGIRQALAQLATVIGGIAADQSLAR